MKDTESDVFDFDKHSEEAVEQYRKVRSTYEELGENIKLILNSSLGEAKLSVSSVEARAKSFDSFSKKSATPLESDPNRPKYPVPLSEITDMAGLRIIAFFPKTLDEIDKLINTQFEVAERSDKGESLRRDDRFGYQSVHYLISLKPARTDLPEYRRFKGLVAELQVRTILQHAWAEIQHDIQYKSVDVIPIAVRRRFLALAGLLELADREFQSIQDDDEGLRVRARKSVTAGDLQNVEITPDAVKAYLDRKLGRDARMSLWSYEFTARLLIRLGFSKLDQVDHCISNYDGRRLSSILYSNQQGQITRFEDMLMAGMGEVFITKHPWSDQDWFCNFRRHRLEQLRNEGIVIGNFVPDKEDSLTQIR